MIASTDLRQEIESVVEAIENVFHVEGDLTEEDVESLHKRFEACINSVNQRLIKCDELLRKGQRAEALRAVETEPNLLELVSILDSISVWDSWSDYVKQFGFPPQSQLLLSLAEELNDHYSKSQSTASLERLQRLYALARAPLKERILVLRELLKREETPIRKSDLIDYEITRHKQIIDEGKRASQKKDAATLKSLADELINSPWISAPPSTTITEVNKSLQDIIREQSLARLENLETLINNAFQEMDIDTARNLREQWCRELDLVELSDNHPLMNKIQAAFAWIEEEDQAFQSAENHRRAVAELVAALELDSSKKAQLSRLFYAAQRFEEPIPERIAARYYERIRTLELAEKRRTVLILSTSLVSVLLIGALIAWQITSFLHKERIAGFIAAAKKLIDQSKLEEADKLFLTSAETNSGLMLDQEVLALRAELDGKIKQDIARIARFNEHLLVVEQLCESGRVEPRWESIDSANSELKQAERIALGDVELTQLKQVELKLRSYEQVVQANTDSRFTEELRSVTADHAAWKDFSPRELAQVREKLSIIDNISRVSKTVKESGRVGLLIAETKELERKANLRAAAIELQKRLVESVGDEISFVRTLEEYSKIDGFPSRSEDFKDVLKNEIAEGVSYPTIWNTAAAKLRRLDRQSVRTEAQSLSESFNILSEKFADLPFFQPIVALAPYLNSASSRVDSSGKVLEELRDYFGEPVFRLKVAERSSTSGKNQLHYFLDDPKPQGKSLEIYPVSVIDTSTRLPAQVGTFDISDSPQRKLAISLRQTIDDKSNAYELTCCIILERILASDVNPLFKAEILQKVSSKLIPSSSVLADHLDSLMEAISPLEDYSGRDWGKSSDTVIESLRSACEKEIADIRKNFSLPKIWREKIEPQIASFERLAQSLPELKWIGFLVKDEGGSTWICETPAKFRDSPNGELFIRYLRSGKTVTEMIGKFIDGNPVLIEKPITGKEGRLVFLATQKQQSEL